MFIPENILIKLQAINLNISDIRNIIFMKTYMYLVSTKYINYALFN